jgi:hypothetical protein
MDYKTQCLSMLGRWHQAEKESYTHTHMANVPTTLLVVSVTRVPFQANLIADFQLDVPHSSTVNLKRDITLTLSWKVLLLD